MHDTQPPITNEEEYLGYQAGLEKLTRAVETREARLIEALASKNKEAIEDRRFELLHILRLRQGIIDAIQAYELQQQPQSA